MIPNRAAGWNYADRNQSLNFGTIFLTVGKSRIRRGREISTQIRTRESTHKTAWTLLCASHRVKWKDLPQEGYQHRESSPWKNTADLLSCLSLPPCGEWGFAEAQHARPGSPCTSPLESDRWSPQEKPVRVKAKRTREEPLCRRHPFLVLSPQASHRLLSGTECRGRQNPRVPRMVFLRLSFCRVKKWAFLLTRWRILQELKLQLTLVSQRTPRAKRCTRCLSASLRSFTPTG